MSRVSIRTAFLSLLFPVIAAAGSYVLPDDRAMIQQADGIAVVVVLSRHSFVAKDGMIYTDYLVGVEETLKGDVAAGATTTIREVGGRVGDEAVVSSTAPHFAPGEKAFVFLTAVAPDAWTTWSGELGKFSFVRDLDAVLLVREASDEEIVGSDFTDERSGGRVRDAEAFLRMVGEVVASAPALAVVTASSILEEGPVAADSAVQASAAANIWNDDPTSNISISIGGSASSNTYGTPNGTNTANFHVPATFSYGAGTKPLSGNTVGQAVLRSAGGQHGPRPGGDKYYTASECDLVVKAGLGASIELEVAAHEMGHCLGFRHSTDGEPSSNDALMFPSVGSGALLRTWDRDAANEVYGDGTFDPASTSGNAFLMVFNFPVPGGARWSTRGFVMNVFEPPGACTNPAITAQPESQSIDLGESATLTVTAVNATSYQWYRGTSPTATDPIAGATSSSYDTAALTASSQFWVRVTNSCGSIDSATSSVTVTSDPQPRPRRRVVKRG